MRYVLSILSMGFVISVALPLQAGAAPPITTAPKALVSAANLTVSLQALGPVEGTPQLIAQPGRRPDVVLRLRTTIPELRKSLHQHYTRQTPLTKGVRVLGYANTAWGEIHVLLGRGQAGQVVQFKPSGKVVLARLQQAVHTPRVAKAPVR